MNGKKEEVGFTSVILRLHHLTRCLDEGDAIERHVNCVSASLFSLHAMPNFRPPEREVTTQAFLSKRRHRGSISYGLTTIDTLGSFIRKDREPTKITCCRAVEKPPQMNKEPMTTQSQPLSKSYF